MMHLGGQVSLAVILHLVHGWVFTKLSGATAKHSHITWHRDESGEILLLEHIIYNRWINRMSYIWEFWFIQPENSIKWSIVCYNLILFPSKQLYSTMHTFRSGTLHLYKDEIMPTMKIYNFLQIVSFDITSYKYVPSLN